MAGLSEIVAREVKAYAGRALNGRTFFLSSPDGATFSVVGAFESRGEVFATVGLIARIVDNLVIVEYDANDKPLVDALVQAGVAREQIILAYAGEKLPPSVAPLPGEHLADRR